MLEHDLEVEALKREIARLEDELRRQEKYIEMVHRQFYETEKTN